ncbi:MAG: GxxExxY protein [Balneolaceae bacterium]|nr:MAG: GxxExxY protein [Balneolaceae bacterium]
MYNDENIYPLQDKTRLIIGLGFEIHKTLGFGFLEIVYKDAFEYEFRQQGIIYEREKKYEVPYKNIILPHKFYADFVVFDDVILEIKAKDGIAPEDMAQTLNYLKCSGCKVGLIINFGRLKLDIKRVVF